jgi:hypothetical protein
LPVQTSGHAGRQFEASHCNCNGILQYSALHFVCIAARRRAYAQTSRTLSKLTYVPSQIATAPSKWSNSDISSVLPTPTPAPVTASPTDLYVRDISTSDLPLDSVTSVYLPPSPLATDPVHGSIAADTIDYSVFLFPTMGLSHSKPKAKLAPKPEPSPAKGEKHSWRATAKGLFSNFAHAPEPVPAAVAEIPPDNIFVPIQQDTNVLPQIPIRASHPVPRKGVIDDPKHTMHTNKFYANAFMGEQNQAIWTHPYSLWWGKGTEDPSKIQTWGMCISHIEETELGFGPGDPASVSICLWR